MISSVGCAVGQGKHPHPVLARIMLSFAIRCTESTILFIVAIFWRMCGYETYLHQSCQLHLIVSGQSLLQILMLRMGNKNYIINNMIQDAYEEVTNVKTVRSNEIDGEENV